MEYLLKNGKTVIIRKPTVEDAEAIIDVMKTADTETLFLGRNPGEFNATVEKEKQIIEGVLAEKDSTWFIAEYEGKIVGQCSVSLIRRNERFRHRSGVAFVLLKDYWNLGIGGKMMEECLTWSKEHDVEQVELEVVKGNQRALNMYLSFGFEVYGVKKDALKYPDGTYADEYFMMKKL